MIISLLAALSLASPAAAEPMPAAYEQAAAAAAKNGPCENVSEIRLENRAQGKPTVTYTFYSRSIYPGTRLAHRLDYTGTGGSARGWDSTPKDAEFVALAAEVNTRSFFALRDEYLSKADGTSAAITLTCADGRSKRVLDSRAAPEAFKALAKRIESLAAAQFWVD